MIANLLPPDIAKKLSICGAYAAQERSRYGSESANYKTVIRQIDEITKQAKIAVPHLYRTNGDDK